MAAGGAVGADGAALPRLLLALLHALLEVLLAGLQRRDPSVEQGLCPELPL